MSDRKDALIAEGFISPEGHIEAKLQAFTQRVEGPYFVSTELGFDIDDISVNINIGGLRLGLDFEGARQLMYCLLHDVVGDCYAAPLMTLIDRLPEVQFDGPFADGELQEEGREAVRELWQAAWRFRHLWPQRNAGYDDRLWGVSPPTGVEVQPFGVAYRVPTKEKGEKQRVRKPETKYMVLGKALRSVREREMAYLRRDTSAPPSLILPAGEGRYHVFGEDFSKMDATDRDIRSLFQNGPYLVSDAPMTPQEVDEMARATLRPLVSAVEVLGVGENATRRQRYEQRQGKIYRSSLAFPSGDVVWDEMFPDMLLGEHVGIPCLVLERRR